MDSMQGMFGGSGLGPGGAIVDNYGPPMTNPSAGGPVFDPGPEGGGIGTIPGSSRTDGGIPTVYGGGGVDWTKIIPAAIPAATGLIGMFTGQGNSTDKAISAMNKSTRPLQQAGNKALQAYSTGTLLPYQQKEKDQIMNAVRAQYNQMYANMGIPVSTSAADIENMVQQAGAQYDNKVYQENFTNAYQASGLASTNLGHVAQMQALQDAEQRKQMQAFMEALGQLGTQIPDWFG